MSEALEIEQQTETRESGFLVRAYAAEVTNAEGRTVDVRIVPYGEQIEHNDGRGGVAKGVVYREEFAPGAFDHQLAAANRVLANAEHEQGIRGIVGHGIALREEKDGLHGSFKIHETAAGETALLLIREGVYDTVSLEAEPRKSVRTADGLVRRMKADLHGIAFARFGAYKGARVLALREEMIVEEELNILDPDPELIERCRRLGIKIPQRYQAHPATADTPAEAGTSDDAAPAVLDTTTSSEE